MAEKPLNQTQKTPSTQTPVAPPPQAKSVKKPCCKPIVWFGLGAAVLLLLFGVWVLMRTFQIPEPDIFPSPLPVEVTDETENWKTYTSSYFNVEFEYPTDWSIEAEEYPAATIINLKSDIESPYNDSPISDQPLYVKYTISIKKISKEYIDSFLVDNPIKTSPITIGGRLGLQTIHYPDGMLNTLNSFIELNESEYLQVGLGPILPEGNYEVQNRTQDLYSQILSTFKFLD